LCLMCVQDITLPEEVISAVAKQLKREARGNQEVVLAMLLDCAVELSFKAPLFALIVGECMFVAAVASL
jgi:hypothetical protein